MSGPPSGAVAPETVFLTLSSALGRASPFDQCMGLATAIDPRAKTPSVAILALLAVSAIRASERGSTYCVDARFSAVNLHNDTLCECHQSF
jgi:hypothetical protein